MTMKYNPTSGTLKKIQEMLQKCQYYRNDIDDLLEDAVLYHYERLKQGFAADHGITESREEVMLGEFRSNLGIS